jgi:hypothetical protein
MLIVFICISVCIASVTGMAVSSKVRNEKRKHVIKCCGRNSCINVKLKKKQQLGNKNASKKITGNFKINRQTTTVSLVADDQNQKLSSPQAGEATATLMDDTTLAENSNHPTDGTTHNMDLPSNEMKSATVSDTTISDAQSLLSDATSKGILSEESQTPAPTSSTAEGVSVSSPIHTSTEVLSKGAIGDIIKGI